jgi:hypothetical protein
MNAPKIPLAVALFASTAADATAQTTSPYSWSNLPTIKQPVFKPDTIRITSFGAVPDGNTLNTSLSITQHSKPVIFAENSSNISFNRIGYNDKSDVLISVSGDRSRNLKMDGTDLSKTNKVSEFSKGANEQSLVVKNVQGKSKN